MLKYQFYVVQMNKKKKEAKLNQLNEGKKRVGEIDTQILQLAKRTYFLGGLGRATIFGKAIFVNSTSATRTLMTRLIVGPSCSFEFSIYFKI